MENLHNWVFTYNTYTKKWNATVRDNYHNLFNSKEGILSSSSINTLIDLIVKTNGDAIKIEKLLG